MRRDAPPLCALLLLAGCSGEPDLIFQPSPQVLIVGQKASVQVTEGGEGSDLLSSSLTLKDADGATFVAGSGGLVVRQVTAREVEFTVPPAIAPGTATLEVKTSQGPAFSGPVTINRLIAVRDLAGKTWLVGLQGQSSAGVTAAAQYAEVQAGLLGLGHGLVHVGYEGRLLASVAIPTRQVQLAWLGASPSISPAKLFSGETLRAVRVAPGGTTLVASDQGTHVIDRPTAITAQLAVNTTLATGETLALAVDRLGKGAAALSLDSASRLAISPIVLSGSAPGILSTIALSWTGSTSPTLAPRVAISPDGKSILVVDGDAGRAALLREGSATATEEVFPSGQSGAVAVAAGADGSTFYVANQTTRNISVISVSGGTISFGTPVDLAGVIGSDSGTIIDLAASAGGEVAILLQHDLLLLDTASARLTALSFPYLFANKTSGEIGGSLAIQP